MVPAAQALFRWFSQRVLLWVEHTFSLTFFFYRSFPFTCFRKLSWLFHCLICSIRTLILLEKISPLFVYKNANCMLGNIVKSSSFAVVTFVGHPCLNSARSLDVYNIIFLVDSHVCGQRNNFMFSKRPKEHTAGTSLLSLCVGHFGKLLIDSGSVWKDYHFFSEVIFGPFSNPPG